MARERRVGGRAGRGADLGRLGVGAAADRAAVPEDAPQDVRANEIARTIARTRDPDWAHDAGPTWVGIVEADEDDVDAWMRDDEAVRGYAPYLIAEDAEIPSDEPMRGVLRNDVVRRRPFDAGQTGLDDR